MSDDLDLSIVVQDLNISIKGMNTKKEKSAPKKINVKIEILEKNKKCKICSNKINQSYNYCKRCFYIHCYNRGYYVN